MAADANKLQCRMKRNIFLRDAGLIIQPLLFWLGASPDGLNYDKSYSDHPGLLEIKCPSNRRNSSPADILHQSFYLQQNKNCEISLRKALAMGLSQVTYCDFVILIFKCMIKTRVEFDNKYFEKTKFEIERIL